MFVSKMVFISLLFSFNIRSKLQSTEAQILQKEEDSYLKENELWINYLNAILQRFNNFNIVFHCYQDNLTEINIVIDRLNAKETGENSTYYAILVQNYNVPEAIGFNFTRPPIPQILHVFYHLDEEIKTIIAQPKNIKNLDVILFLSKENSVMRKTILTIGEVFIKTSRKTLVIEKESGKNSIEIYKICYFCGENSMEFLFLQSTNSLETRLKDKSLLPSKFTDLNTQLFKISFIPSFPIVTCDENVTQGEIQVAKNLTNVECIKVTGIEGKLLKIISKYLNFTYNLYFMTPDAGWKSMIDLVNQNEVDFAIGGISVTSDRIPLVQFTQVFNFESYNFIYVFELTFKEIFDNFMSPFKAVLVWGLYFLSFFVLSLVFYAMWKVNLGGRQFKISFESSLWTLLLIIIEQSNPYIDRFYQKRTSCGLVLALWWCCSLVFCTMYKSTVLSATAYPPNLEPQDLDGLLKAGYILTGNQQSVDIIMEVLQGQDGVYQEARSKIIYGKNTCDAFSKILSGHVAMLDEQNTIQYEVRSSCKKPDDYQLELLRICKHPVSTTGHAWAFQTTAPYAHAVNRHINHVIEAGLFKKWVKEAVHIYDKDQIHFAREKNTGGIKALSLKRILPLFLIYAIGILVSSITLIFEFVFRFISKNIRCE